MEGSDAWAAYFPSLTHDYHVLAIDPLGLGGSGRPLAPEAYSFSRQVAHVIALMDREGVERAHLWGYSAGGQLAAAVAQAHPARIRSLAVGGQVPIWRPPDPELSESQAAALLVEGWDGYWRQSDAGVTPERQRAYRARVEPGIDPAVFAARLRGMALPYEAGRRFAGPKLCYAGSLEPWVELAREGMARLGARFVVIEGEDHGGAFNAHERVEPVIREFHSGVD
jgi:pimeloyl-ACP methyl ester carboxylesterase